MAFYALQLRYSSKLELVLLLISFMFFFSFQQFLHLYRQLSLSLL